MHLRDAGFVLQTGHDRDKPGPNSRRPPVRQEDRTTYCVVMTPQSPPGPRELMSLLGIDIPLLAFSHCRDVVAAVTNAGGFGVFGALGSTPSHLDDQLRWIDEQVGGRPYGVDIVLPARSLEDDHPDTGDLERMIPDAHRVFLAE